VVLDVDGVLTDGRIGYGPEPGEIKFFHVRDGHAMKMLRRARLQVGLLSGRSSAANRRRAEELELDFVYEGEKDKNGAFVRLLAERCLAPEDCLYVGDDVVDIPVLKRVGVAVAVADAVPEVKAVAHWVTGAAGGHGAVREVAVWLLHEQGRWQELMKRYQEPAPGAASAQT
jgi:3-deoxy-D-manno-octulosonate 8-phosphate phosphatase (KDO 8-P phosphatase)